MSCFSKGLELVGVVEVGLGVGVILLVGMWAVTVGRLGEWLQSDNFLISAGIAALGLLTSGVGVGLDNQEKILKQNTKANK